MSEEKKVAFGLGPDDYKQAEWLARKLENGWRYDHSTQRWHEWTGIRWAPDTVERIKYRVARLAAMNVTKAESDEQRKALTKLFNIAPIGRALEALSSQADYSTDGSDWDQDEYIMGADNGIIDLRTNELVENPDPSCLVTRTTKVAFRPLSGPSEFEERAPVFMRFLHDITSEDPEMVSFLLLWFGSSMFGFSPEQRFLLMTGIGRNGKGALKHAIMRAVGEYGSQPDANIYMRNKMGAARSDAARADLMDLKGRRICFFSEPDGNRFNEEMLKAHTGGDLITARNLFSSHMVSWAPTHSITFLVNNAPEVEDLGPSMGARVMVADFRERYDGEREDKRLYHKLEEEAEGILAILVWAASAWHANWKATGVGITLPKRVEEQSRKFMSRGDSVGAFIDEACVLEDTESKSSVLYAAYTEWHHKSGEYDEEPMSQVRFTASMERKGFKKVKRAAGMFFKGIRNLRFDELVERDDEE